MTTTFDGVRRTSWRAGVLAATVGVLALLPVGTGCSCTVDCSGTLAALTSDDPAVTAVEVCAEGGCVTEPATGTPTTSEVVGGDSSEGDFRHQSGTRDYTVRLLGMDGTVIAEGSTRTDLSPSGKCSCGRALLINFDQGELTLTRS